MSKAFVVRYLPFDYNMRSCAICGKGSVIRGTRVLLRGHYNLTKTERKYPNLQWVRLPVGQRVKACTQCMKNIHSGKSVVRDRAIV